MRKVWLTIASSALVATLLGLMGCGNPTPGESNFNLIFKYGVSAKNILDTFEGTYTKDMVMDPSITVNISLSEEELDRIYKKMVKIDFFSYPEKFKVSPSLGEIVGIVTLYSRYYFRVEYDSQIKELSWDDELIYKDEKADRLREVIKLIRDIIESKEEYKELPEPTSGYL